jgi:hypothetical protein
VAGSYEHVVIFVSTTGDDFSSVRQTFWFLKFGKLCQTTRCPIQSYSNFHTTEVRLSFVKRMLTLQFTVEREGITNNTTPLVSAGLHVCNKEPQQQDKLFGGLLKMET